MSLNSKGVEILSIGTELLLGNIINTNAQWISEQLSLLGLNHFRQSTVGDNCDRIINCLLYTSPSPRDREKSRMPSSA